ncbi:MAG: hypothetical protein ACKOHK_08100 [Planctomycetia bacterium]
MRRSVLVKTLLGCLIGLLVASAVVVALVRYEPVFYRQVANPVAVGPGGEEAEVLARRAVTRAAAWQASMTRPGRWDVALAAAEINAWLAVDLPRNHPDWLPRRVSQPRIQFQPQHVLLGSRVRYGSLAAVAWLDLEIQVRDVNQLAIALNRAGLGGIPLPRMPILRELARQIGRLGIFADLRMLDGRMVLMVYIPSTHDAGATSYRLESLAIGAGELLVAGQIRSSAPGFQSRD